MEGFNCSDTCWEVSTAGHKQPRKFLECTDSNFLTQMIKELMRGDTVSGPHTYKQGRRTGWECEGLGEPWLQ